MATTTKPAEPGGRVEVTLKKAFGPGDDKVHTWPHLIRAEFLCGLLVDRCASGGTSKPGANAESLEGTLVFPRFAGDFGVL